MSQIPLNTYTVFLRIKYGDDLSTILGKARLAMIGCFLEGVVAGQGFQVRSITCRRAEIIDL